MRLGGLLKLYKKERFKGGVSWWDCVHCGHSHKSHKYREGEFHHCNEPIKSSETDILYDCHCNNHVPKNLDELGDWWYYLRILAWQQKIDLSEWTLPKKRFVPDDMFMILAHLNSFCAKLLLIYEDNENIEKLELATAFSWFQDVLFLLDFSLDQLTEQNYDKLKDGDNNGWQATLEKNL